MVACLKEMEKLYSVAELRTLYNAFTEYLVSKCYPLKYSIPTKMFLEYLEKQEEVKQIAKD